MARRADTKPHLVGGPKHDVELEARTMVHDRLGVKLAQLGESAARAEQPRVEEVGRVSAGLEREVRLALALPGEVGELEDLLGQRQLDEIPLVRQQRRW